MMYKWKPSATQRREFAERMADPEQRAAYEEKKAAKIAKRQGGSQFDYFTAGGRYIATREQHDFCLSKPEVFKTEEQQEARRQVMYSFSCQERIYHDYIHIINELRRTTK
jgi:hypothetical protein